MIFSITSHPSVGCSLGCTFSCIWRHCADYKMANAVLCCLSDNPSNIGQIAFGQSKGRAMRINLTRPQMWLNLPSEQSILFRSRPVWTSLSPLPTYRSCQIIWTGYILFLLLIEEVWELYQPSDSPGFIWKFQLQLSSVNSSFKKNLIFAAGRVNICEREKY